MSHQQEALVACQKAILSNSNGIAVSSPTGSGKTHVMFHLINWYWREHDDERDNPTLAQMIIVVPSISIAQQTFEAAQRILVGELQRKCTVSLEQGQNRSDGKADLTIATWQSLIQNDRIQSYKPEYHGLVIFDEAHHSPAPSCVQISHYFNQDVPLYGGLEPLGSQVHRHRIQIVGFSATLNRIDRFKVSHVLPDKVYHGYASPLIEAGILAPMKYMEIKNCPRVRHINLERTQQRDKGDDEEVDEHYQINNSAIISTLQKLPEFHERRSRLIFVSRIFQAESLLRAMTTAGITAGLIIGETEPVERKRIFDKFESGAVSTLINCGALTEGVNLPYVDCIVNARPTKSPIRLIQTAGRGRRVSKDTNKCDCLFIDFTGSFEEVAPEAYKDMEILPPVVMPLQESPQDDVPL